LGNFPLLPQSRNLILHTFFDFRNTNIAGRSRVDAGNYFVTVLQAV